MAARLKCVLLFAILSGVYIGIVSGYTYRLWPFNERGNEGFLEVYHEEEWGLVGSYNFQFDNFYASWVCQDLNISLFGYGGKWEPVGSYTGFSWIPFVYCNWRGTCDFASYRRSPVFSADAGSFEYRYGNSLHCVDNQLGRFGQGYSEGILHVGINGSRYRVCYYGFDMNAAEVVCNHLGFSGAVGFINATNEVPDYNIFTGSGTWPVYTNGFNCTGSEYSLLQCNQTELLIEDCQTIVDLTCIAARLVSTNDHKDEGALEIYDEGWKFVGSPGHTISDQTARYICDKLGFGPSGFALQSHQLQEYGGISQHDFIDCIGNETLIQDCTIAGANIQPHTCGSWLYCFDFYITNARLLDGSSQNDGRVELEINGRWGLISTHGIANYQRQTVANVACRTLGFRSARTFYLGEATRSDLFWMSGVDCPSSATSITECSFVKGAATTCDWPLYYLGVACQGFSLGEQCTEDKVCSSTDAICIENTCQCQTGIYDQRTDTCDAMPLFAFATNEDTDLGPEQRCSNTINYQPGLPMYGEHYKNVQVCRQGFVKFESKSAQMDTPRLAPFSTEFELERGNVYYRAYHILSYDIMMTNKEDIELIETVVTKYSGLTEFDASFVLIATWDNVYSNSTDFDNTKSETFQLVLVTDGTYTFTFYIYGHGEMNWEKRIDIPKDKQNSANHVYIGTYFGTNSYSHPNSFSDRALKMDTARQKGISGIVYIPLFKQPIGSLPSDPSTECIKWYNKNRDEEEHMNVISTMLPDCPCDIGLSQWDPWFWNVDFDKRTDTNHVCVEMMPGKQYEPYGKSCCYDLTTWLWVDERSVAGNIYRYNQDHPDNHFLHDTQPKDMCCSTPYCHLFYKLRPQGVCYDATPFNFGTFWGDPHFQTLDGLNFTFNGLGEYTLLLLESNNVTFELQARLAQATNKNGSLIDATIFSAFAAQENGNSTFHVELNKAKRGLTWYSNGIDKSVGYANASREGGRFVHRSDDGSQIISKRNKAMTVFFPTSGIAFNVTVNAEMLTLVLVLPEKYRNQTIGLLGNFNGNPDDDFILPDGTTLSSSMSERDIFQYGQNWAINSDESHFVYEKGMSHEDFHNSSFVPKFLVDVESTSLETAAAKCNGSRNVECVLDFVATGREDVAIETLTIKGNADVTNKQMDEVLPSLHGCSAVNIKVNEEVVCPVTISDGADVTFLINNVNARYDPDEQLIKFIPGAENPDVRVVAVNVNNSRSSTMFIMEGMMCNGCSSHGICNFKERVNSRATDHIKHSACDCQPPYTGDDCESVFDGCEEIPCSLDRSCTSLRAEEQIEQNRTYVCDPCPEGYIGSGESNEICTDTDECEQSPCQHECINTDGSYQCICNEGYRISSTDSHICRDINECEEFLNNCTQVCNNYDGSYNCSCFTGYFFNASTNDCELDELTGDACTSYSSNCLGTAGCKVDEDGNPSCFCEPGFELNEAGLCEDINECESNACPQICENTNGSFNCLCLPGYELDALRECKECDSSHWGNNCEQDCICTGQGAMSCDPIRGCLCSDGWKGNTCDDNVDECSDVNICNDPMKYCVDYPGSYNCLCRNGYVETADGHCEDFNECLIPLNNDCQQICVNTQGSYSCQCEAGFNIRNKTSCEDIDECSIGKHNCEQICSNYAGAYNCFCYVGYSLNDDRQTCTELEDPCLEVANLTCAHFCHVGSTEVECRCRDGYILGSDQQSCEDVDECFVEKSLCTDVATCLNTNGSYECECPAGFRLDNDGRTCLECDDHHFGLGCKQTCNCLNGVCNKLTGCFCDAGWNGDNCSVDINECGLGDICTDLNTVCINTPGGYECRCDTGYMYYNDSGVCKDVDECNYILLNDCDQLCTNTIGSYTCQCRPGFLITGNKCEDINECDGHHNCNQLCENTLGSYKCYCEDGFKLNPKTRQQCIPISECDQSQKDTCGINTSCFVENDEARCTCNKGFDNSTGSCLDTNECIRLDVCDQNCENTEGNFICSCEAGFTLLEDQTSCKVCGDWTFGEECASNCSCQRSTTESCDHITGQCLCKEDWQGTVCGTDIDECNDITTCPNEHSNCTNTMGGFECGCKTGYLVSEDDDACQVCGNWTFGEECSSNCFCNETTTESCNHVTGQCMCKEGWQGTVCGTDVDECDNDTTCPNDYSNCTNTAGGFVCGCETGYYAVAANDSLCFECPEWTYGIDCMSSCSCNQSNTLSCDHVTGLCTCAEGWNDTNCDNDVDECDDNTTCPNPHSLCNNTMGGFDCNCENGYYTSNNSLCEECEEWNYGFECTEVCACNQTNTRSCDHVTGVCDCEDDWTGPNCSQHINQCNPASCPGEHAICVNRPSWFRCECGDGYQMTSSGICRAMDVIVMHTLRINFDLQDPADLNNQSFTEKLEQSLVLGLSDFYSGRVNHQVIIRIHSISIGSLIVDYSVAYAVQDSKVMSDIVKVIQELNDGSELQIDGIDYTVVSESTGASNEPCEVFTNIFGECKTGHQCVVENDEALCREEKNDYDIEIIIIVSAATAAFVFICVIMLVVVNLRICTERQKRKQQHVRSDMTNVFNKFGRHTGTGQLMWRSSMIARNPDQHMAFKIPRPRLQRSTESD